MKLNAFLFNHDPGSGLEYLEVQIILSNLGLFVYRLTVTSVSYLPDILPDTNSIQVPHPDPDHLQIHPA